MAEPQLLTKYEEFRTPTTLATGFPAGTWVVEVTDGVFEPCDPPQPAAPKPKAKPKAKKKPAVDYSSLTVKELKVALDKKGVEYKAKATKKTLLGLLEGA